MLALHYITYIFSAQIRSIFVYIALPVCVTYPNIFAIITFFLYETKPIITAVQQENAAKVLGPLNDFDILD